jgi:hypothetical protein
MHYMDHTYRVSQDHLLIKMKNETWLNESGRSSPGGNTIESCHAVWRVNFDFFNNITYMSHAISYGVTQVLVMPRTLARPKGLVLKILVWEVLFL